MAARSSKRTRSPKPDGLFADWIYHTVCISVLVIPLTVSLAGRDSFRLPKELVFRAEALILIALILSALILGHLQWKRLPWRHPAITIPLAVIVWSIVTTAMSTNFELSVRSMIYAMGACLVFVATWSVARGRPLKMLNWLIWSGIINAGLYLAVALRIIDNPLPLYDVYRGLNSVTGLLGNANDVGAALLPIAIAAAAAAGSSPKRRAFYTSAAVLITAAILVSVSIAAIGALIVAAGALAFVWNWKRALLLFVLIGVSLGGLTLVSKPLKHRLTLMKLAAAEGQWDEMLSGRLNSFTAAIAMFRDHPVTGVGPGTFGWQYYPYKLEVSEKAPDLYLRSAASRFNFEETHNDHLEVLSETGFPGYMLLLGALVFLGSGSFRPRHPSAGEGPDDRVRFSRLAQLPTAVGFAVVALAQYPLQLTSALSALIFVSALCVAWRDDLPSFESAEVSDDA